MPVAPLPTLAGVFYGIISGHAAGKPVSNIFCLASPGFILTDPRDTTAALTMATSFGTHWGGVATALIADNYTATQAKVYPLGSPLLPAQISSFVAPGGITTGYSFLQVAGLIKHTVIRRGRGSQSHTFISPLSELSVTTDGTAVTNAWVLAADAAFPAFMNAVVADMQALYPTGWQYVQLSKKPTPRVFEIHDSSADVPISSQDRRLGR